MKERFLGIILLLIFLSALPANTKPTEKLAATHKETKYRRRDGNEAGKDKSPKDTKRFKNIKGHKPGRDYKESCSKEEAIEEIRKLIRQWPDYVNTGNQQYLISNYIHPEATITQTGNPLDSFCLTVTRLLKDQLLLNKKEDILSDVVNVKRIKFNDQDSSITANFVLASGVKGFNLTLSNESWVFSTLCNRLCDYKVAEVVSVKLECLQQVNNFPVIL